jgi:hypothetical protein
MNQENLIFGALAYDDKANPSPSLGLSKIKTGRVFEIYIKNAIVSLISAKRNNPESGVGLVVNIELEDKWKRMLEDNGILVWVCPFDKFKMPDWLVYSLSYYKLCAFDYVLNNTDFKRFCFIDCDTISFKNYADLWVECDDAFMIVPNDEPYYAKVRKEINELYTQLYNKDERTLTHYASGFIIGERKSLLEIIRICQDVYNRLMVLPKIVAEGGDEIVWSIALADYKGIIKSPKTYCLLSFATATSYWIDKQDYTDENVVMWHLPADKRYSMIWAYNYFVKKGNLPPVEKMAKASRIRNVKTKYSILALQAILEDKTVIMRNIKKIFCKRR